MCKSARAYFFILSISLISLIPQGGLSAQESEDKETEGLNAGYNIKDFSGFYIQSGDGAFKMNLGGYTQLRYHLNYRITPPAGDENLTSGFYVNRTRLYMKGEYTPKFHYKFQINIDNEGLFKLWEASLQYDINSRWAIRGGLSKVPQSREDWTSPENVLTSERSANDFTFAVGSAYNIVAAYRGPRVRHSMGISNGNFGSKYNYPKSGTHSLGFYSRWEYQLIGRDWKSWNNLTGKRGQDFGMLLGWAAGYTRSLPDADANFPKNNGQVNLDLSVGGDGFQLMASTVWTYAIVDPKDPAVYHHNSFGLMVQGGYFIAEKHQLYTQYNLVSPGPAPGRFTNYNTLTAGYSFFPFVRTNRWKFTLEGAYLFEALNDTLVRDKVSLGFHDSDEAGQFYFRIQAQFGF